MLGRLSSNTEHDSLLSASPFIDIDTDIQMENDTGGLISF